MKTGREVEVKGLLDAAMALYTEAIGQYERAQTLLADCVSNVCQNQRHEIRVGLARAYLLAHRVYEARHPGTKEDVTVPSAETDILVEDDCDDLKSPDAVDDCKNLCHAKVLYGAFLHAERNDPRVTDALREEATSEIGKIQEGLQNHKKDIEDARQEEKALAAAEEQAKARAEAERRIVEEQAKRKDQQRRNALRRLEATEKAAAERSVKQSRRQLSAGIGLAATGGVISVVGVGVSLPFAAAPRNAIDNPAWPEAVHEAGELERNRFKMKTPYYSAWVTGAVGGAILLSGVALIVTTIVVKNKKAASSTSARLRPGLGGLEVQF